MVDFVKKNWQFRDIITEGELNRIEEGVEEGIAKAEAAQQAADNAQTAADEANQKADQNTADLIAHLNDKVPHVVPSAKVSSSLNLSIPNATSIALSFDTVKWDNDNIFVPTNPTRLTAKTAGKYLVWANLHFSPNENGNRHITLRKNGQSSQAFAQARYRATVGSAIATVVFCAGIIDMAVNDYVEVIVFQDSGQSIDIEVQAEYSPIFGMVRVG